jgi:PAS domain-containing protein
LLANSRREKVMLRKDGSRWWGLFAPTRLSSTGTDCERSEFIIDITERKAAKAATRANEDRFRTLFDSAPVAVFVCDENAVIQHHNRGAEDLWGTAPASDQERDFASARLRRLDGEQLPRTQNPIIEVTSLRSPDPRRNASRAT